jgi:hypothetical protein
MRGPAVPTQISVAGPPPTPASPATGLPCRLCSGTALRLPPGVLAAGKSYYAILEARSSGNADFQGHPFRSTYPEAKAMTVTGSFTP